MRQMITALFSFVFFVGYAQAAQVEAVSIRCSTNNASGNYSVFIGTLTEEGLSGNLSRGMNTESLGAGRTTFAISALGIPSGMNGVLAFQFNGDLRMPAPFDQVGWENPNFTVSKTLMRLRRGSMVETGTAFDLTRKTAYKYVYKCVSI